MNIKIKDIPQNDRPRERLIHIGSEYLSNEDLLAILLKTGTKTNSAKNLAIKILKEIDDIKNLKNITYNELKKINGIGPAKACSILAAIELGKRINQEIEYITDLKFNNAQNVYNYYKNIIGNKKQEYFYCLYLDNNKIIIKDKLLFIGTINKSLIHPREIFKEAYILSATSIICVHNHPTGNTIPSNDDIKTTKKLIEIGNLLGINIIDHIIIGTNNYYSFYENNDI